LAKFEKTPIEIELIHFHQKVHQFLLVLLRHWITGFPMTEADAAGLDFVCLASGSLGVLENGHDDSMAD
jgi:hypothetical protein